MQALHLFYFAANECGTKTGKLPSLYKGLCPSGTVEITSLSDVLKLIANATQIAMGIAGGLAVLLILLASIYYIISVGDPGRTKKAKDIIQYTVFGLVLIIMAYAIVGFIAGGL
jgi:hypothetical protein